MIITFTDPDSVNRAILNGLVICNKKVLVSKCKWKPVRCLRCQGYNHEVNEWIIQRDICTKCRENHRTSNCGASTLRCTPCGTPGHAGSNWTCPTFLRKCTENDTKNPKNSLPFYLSTEPWTWEAAPPSGHKPAAPVELADYVHLDKSGKC